MLISALIFVPVLAGVAALLLRSDRLRRLLLVLTGVAHTGLVGVCWAVRPGPIFGGWLQLDGPGLLFLAITSVLFLAAAIQAAGYLSHEPHGAHEDFDEEGLFFSNAPEAIFTGCLLFFLGTMTLVTMSQHFGLLWVAIEATTLASAPLIYFHRHRRSLEATWKYLLICSVGIALALLGTFFLAGAATFSGGVSSLLIADLVRVGHKLDPMWLKAAFILLLVGYGTKMGLAPLHTWLPDAHSESPSVVSALLSGALLNCAFLGILRAQQVCEADGAGEFSRELLLIFGLISMGVAAVFIVGQRDYKRLLAYSSVEHMGILALGVGLGGLGTIGALLHAVNHSLTKAMLFFAAGNILAVYKTKSASDVRGVLTALPLTGILWVAGFLAITGFPPFGPFLSEFTILKAAIEQGHTGVAIAYLFFLSVIFVGMATIVIRMSQGAPTQRATESQAMRRREPLLGVLSPALLCALVLCLGLYTPPQLSDLLKEAAQVLRAQEPTDATASHHRGHEGHRGEIPGLFSSSASSASSAVGRSQPEIGSTPWR
ncbi:MAG TPA: proton-conducting transporter membrane subunit [Planctomycetota bacterium]|jgi:hydrogenase-4 component F